MPSEQIVSGFTDEELEPWRRFVEGWFCGTVEKVISIEGPDHIDGEMLGRHMHALMRTFSTKHEDKITGVSALCIHLGLRIVYQAKGSKQPVSLPGRN